MHHNGELLYHISSVQFLHFANYDVSIGKGWIPERIFFPEDPSMIKDFETPTDRAWERLLGANSFGDCLITVSTSKDLSDEDADNVGLFTAHAYAVLDVVQTSNGTKLLQLKNPWASKVLLIITHLYLVALLFLLKPSSDE